MKLFVQPENGVKPILNALRHAKKSIRILIFRFDRSEVEKELVAAAQRGVIVKALIAYTNRGEEDNLRRLEMRLLEKGITVARTADDLVRYHGKMIIVDETLLIVLGYNFTHLDIDLSRSFGIATIKSSTVKEALKLFECDSNRQPYSGGKGELVVSPINSRDKLMDFIKGTKKTLLIYEMKISDVAFLKLLEKKISEGVGVRILSRGSAKSRSMPVRKLCGRMHLRCMIRDGNSAFVGSQSLKKLELEARREIGIIFNSKATVQEMEKVFEKDWNKSEPLTEAASIDENLKLPAKAVAKQIAKKVQIKAAIEKVLDKAANGKKSSFEPEQIAQTVRDVFREEIQGAVVSAVQDIMAKDDPKTTTSSKNAES